MRLRSASFIVFACCFFAACQESVFDYRHKYVGDFWFSLALQTVGQPNGSGAVLNSVDEGEVDYGNDGMLRINYYESIVIEVAVDGDGNLSMPGKTPREFSGKYDGRKSLVFRYIYPSPSQTGEEIQLDCAGTRN